MRRSLVSMPISTEPKLRADFFRYSKRAMSSSGPSISRKSRSAPGRCGKRMMKYFFSPSKRSARSLTSGSRSKSKLPPDTTQTMVLPLISFLEKSFSASIASAPAGSSTTPSTLSISIIVAQSRFSGISRTASAGNSLRCRNGSRPISATAAPSTKLSTLASLTRLPAARLSLQAWRAGRLAEDEARCRAPGRRNNASRRRPARRRRPAA